MTTAAGITAVMDLVLTSGNKYRGFVAQEQFRLTDILGNRFGRYYATGGTNEVSSQMVVRGQAGRQRQSRAARSSGAKA